MPLAKYDPSLFSDTPPPKSGGSSVASPDGIAPYNPAMFDDDSMSVAEKPKDKPGALLSFGREALGAVVPTVGGLVAGSVAGAMTPGPPLVKGAMAIAGGLAGGYEAAKGQAALLDDHPDVARTLGQSPEQQQADEDTNPIASRLGRVAPNLAAFRPTTDALNLLRSGASDAAKELGKTALKTGAFNAAVSGGVTAGQQAYDGEFDPSDLAIQTAAGFLGQKATRLGRMLPGHVANEEAPTDQEVTPDAPTSLLALPRGTDFYASESGLVSPDRDIRAAANTAAVPGTQGDLFALGGEDTSQTPRPGMDVSQPVDQAPPPDQGGQAPVPMGDTGQPSLFTAKPTANVVTQFGPADVRQAVIGPDKPDAYSLKLAQKVHAMLKDNDPVAAAQHVDTEQDNLQFADLKPKTIDTRKAQLDRAQQVVKDFVSKSTNAMAEEAVQQPRPEPANNVAPAPVEPSVAAIREDNAQRTQAEVPKPGPTDADIAHANQVVDDSRRKAILDHVLADPDTISPAKRFAALLKRQNLDPAPRSYEKEEIVNHLVRKGRIDDAKTAFAGLTETGHEPDTSGTAALEAHIPERVETPPPEPKPAAPVERPAEDFQLQSQSEGDLQRIEAARVRREGKVTRRDAATEAAKPAAVQGEMFTEKGNPTKAASKRPVLPKDEAAKPETKKPKSKENTDGRKEGNVDAQADRPQKSDDGRQEGQPNRKAHEENGQERLLKYSDVKKRADAAVSARSITPAQHGMVEAAIEAKSHTPEELTKELDKILERSAEKPFGHARDERKPFGRKVREGNVLGLIKSGATAHDVISHIIDTSTNKDFVQLATRLRDILKDNMPTIRAMDKSEITTEHGDINDGLYYGNKHEIAIGEPGEHAEQVILHELVHAATANAIGEGTPAGKEITRLYEAYQKTSGPIAKYEPSGDQYGFHSAHEFVAEALTNKHFMDILNGIKEGGDSLLTKFVNIVRKMLGMPKIGPLTEIMGVEPRLLKGSLLEQAGVESSRYNRWVMSNREPSSSADNTFAKVRKNIEEAPEPQREGLRNMARVMRTARTKGFAALAMGNNLYDMAHDRGITFARALERMDGERTGAANAMIQPHLKLIENARKLPHETLEAVNRLIQDSTSKWEYAFHPGYLREAIKDPTALGGFRHEPNRKLGINAKVNPELNERYKALPPAARKVVTEAFRLSHDRLYDEKSAVLSSVASSYDGLIHETKEALRTATDPGKRTALKKELQKYNEDKKQELTYYSGLLNIDASRPYAPLTRNGNWLVAAKSDKYLEAERAGDTKALKEMQSDPEHYFIHFAGSHMEGLKLAGAIKGRYGDLDKNVFVQERNKFADKLYSGRDMSFAVGRLENLARQSGSDRRIRQIITDLKLKVLSQNSIRRAEMQRLNVAAGNLDMMSNVLSHGRSSAHFIGSIYHAEDTLKALQSVIKEVEFPSGKQKLTGREDRAAVVNEITARYLNGMSRPPDDDFLTLTANKLNSATSLYMLGVKPAYYVQQAIQSWMYSHPVMAARFGYGKATASLARAYKTVTHAADGPLGLFSTNQLDLSKLDPKYQGLANHMFQSGILEVGINTEMGVPAASSLGKVDQAYESVMAKVRAMSRKVESINRLTAGIANFDLDMANPKGMQVQHDPGAYDAYLRDFDHVKQGQGHNLTAPLSQNQFTAADNSVRMVRQTHGDLSMANTPTFLRGPVGRVIGQFKKFPLIMAGMYGREINRAFFNKETSPAERAIARKSLMYLFGHGALVAGGMGIPGYNIAKIVYDWLASSDNDPHDMEVDIRKAIGNEQVADLLLKGAPSLAGVDASGTLGQGNLLSVAPYVDFPTDRDSYYKFLAGMSGPALGGLIPQIIDGLGYAGRGDYYKGLEKVLPRGLSDGLRAFREQTKGETNKNGEVTTEADDIPTMDAVWRAMGFSPLDQSNRQTAGDIKYQQEDYYKGKVSAAKRDYITAHAANDAAAMAQARMDWKTLQDQRAEHGLKRQPLGDLMKAPHEQAKREKNTAGGMQYTRRDKEEVQDLGDLFSTDASEDDNDVDLQDALAK